MSSLSPGCYNFFQEWCVTSEMVQMLSFWSLGCYVKWVTSSALKNDKIQHLKMLYMLSFESGCYIFIKNDNIRKGANVIILKFRMLDAASYNFWSIRCCHLSWCKLSFLQPWTFSFLKQIVEDIFIIQGVNVIILNSWMFSFLKSCILSLKMYWMF